MATSGSRRARARACLAIALSVAAAFASACSREEPAPAPVEEERPPSLQGNAAEHGLAMKQLQLEPANDGFDVRFEISSSAKGIVELRAADSASGDEAELLVETFRRGAWRKETVAGAGSKKVELWPGGTQYGRANIPSGARWARVVVTARGVDGAAANAAVEIVSDAIELPPSR